MIAVSLTSLLLILIVNFTTNAIINVNLTAARADLLREAQLAMDAMTLDIRLSSNADDLNRVADPNGPGADEFGWISDESNLILATAAMDADRNIIFEDALSYSSLKNNNIYFVQNNTLYKRTLAADDASNAATTSCPEAVADATCPSDRKLITGIVSVFNVRYMQADNTEAANPTDARSVEINLQLDAERFGRNVTAEYTTRTVFRNE
jgi:type II secretory pathway component PulJ